MAGNNKLARATRASAVGARLRFDLETAVEPRDEKLSNDLFRARRAHQEHNDRTRWHFASTFAPRGVTSTADQRPSGLTVAAAPATLNSPTHFGRVANQKCPLARMTPGSGVSTNSANRSGSSGRRARHTKLVTP